MPTQVDATLVAIMAAEACSRVIRRAVEGAWWLYREELELYVCDWSRNDSLFAMHIVFLGDVSDTASDDATDAILGER